MPLRAFLRNAEIEHITRALEQTGGNQSEAARRLGVPRRTLVRKIADLGIDRSAGRKRPARREPAEPPVTQWARPG